MEEEHEEALLVYMAELHSEAQEMKHYLLRIAEALEKIVKEP